MKMCVRKRGLWIAAITLFLFLALSFSTEAAIKTGGVEIALECYEEAGRNKRIFYEKTPALMPGEKISYILSVNNIGSDVWVRLHISFWEETRGNLSFQMDDTCLIGVEPSWIKRGNYWYYTKPLKSGTQADFCKGICVPDFDELPGGLKFTVSSTAEAIQAANTWPDFSGDDPFSGLLIEEAVGRKCESETVCGIEARYANGAETIVNAAGLFDEIDEWMPGDIHRETVVIKNNNPMDVQVKLKVLPGEVDELLWNRLRLIIRRGTKTVYEGGLADHKLRNEMRIGVFQGKCEETLEFEISIPRDEKNMTAFQKAEAVFLFSAERIKDNPVIDHDFKSEHAFAEKIFSSPDLTITEGYSKGSWKLVDESLHKWEYLFEDGTKAKAGWCYLLNPYSPDENKYNWFCFDAKGIMQFGWIRTKSGNWYFCHEIPDGNLGKLKLGWHQDMSDHRTYYLDPITGIMQTGWKNIGGQMYYFTPLEHTKRQNWFWNTEIGRWLYDFLGYRTYGSMYQGEKTPDGYCVDESGIWDGQEKAGNAKK